MLYLMLVFLLPLPVYNVFNALRLPTIFGTFTTQFTIHDSFSAFVATDDISTKLNYIKNKPRFTELLFFYLQSPVVRLIEHSSRVSRDTGHQDCRLFELPWAQRRTVYFAL